MQFLTSSTAVVVSEIADPPADTDVRPADRPRRWIRALAPAGFFLVIRGAGVGLLAVLAAVHKQSPRLDAWDGGWYLAVAKHGYLGVPSDMLDMYGHHRAATAMVFFPGYPLMVRLMAVVCDHNYLVAGVIVSTVAGVAAAYGVARLARRYTTSRRVAMVMVVLFAAAPMSIVYSMAYPEALLCAFTAWALVGLTERKWWLTGAAAAAAGYVSPMGAPVVATVMAVALIDIVKGRARWPAVATLMMAPAGILGYILWVANQTGRGDGYFLLQRLGWGSGFDFGWSMLKWIGQTLSGDQLAYTVATAWIVVACIGLLAAASRRGTVPWQVWLYSLFAVVLAVGASGIQWDKTRLLLVAFPLLLPVARRVAGYRAGNMVAVTVVLALAGVWFSAYALAVWPYSI
jgi:hypothetical protein